MEIDHSISGN